MKKTIALLSVLIMLLSLAACGTLGSEPQGSVAPSATPELRETVAFSDPVLEAMVRGTMGKPEGDISAAEAAAVTRLDLSADWERNTPEWTPVKDLDGLEYFTGLESLDLSEHAITDITPLARLTKLTTLALGSNPVADIAPLAGLTSLKTLILTGCAAQDYGPLASLTGLAYLRLDNSTIADAAPLAALTSLKRLYLAGCKLSYSPLAEIYPNLEDKDFIVATTLAEYGFYMDNAQATYDGETVSVRINHIEWGMPMAMGAENCVRVVFGTGEYKVDIGYYPEHDAYVVQAYKDGDFAVNYVYAVADGGVNCSTEDRELYETHLRAIFPDTEGENLLLEPVSFYNTALEDALGMTATELFALPFEPPSLTSLGFAFNEETGTYTYFEREPHDADISVYRPEFGDAPDGQSVTFFDSDVGGYHLIVHYFADDGRYQVSLHMNEKECAYDIYPDMDKYSEEYPDTETVRSMLSAAFGTQEEDMYTEPLVHLKKYIMERFNMSIDELYALPVGHYDHQ